jgi:hypothetical protein
MGEEVHSGMHVVGGEVDDRCARVGWWRYGMERTRT